MSISRVWTIVRTVRRFGLADFLHTPAASWRVRLLIRLLGAGRRHEAPRGERLRLALESLGPIFVKFGQVLSTRRDLMPPDLADELARLQDKVTPFPWEQAAATLERNFGQSVPQVFQSIQHHPVASASVAQVHFAVLHDGQEVAVKVLRPGIRPVIGRDLGLLHTVAVWVERLFADGKRLRPREVVAEFAKHLDDELDLLREAANGSVLRRHFEDSPLLRVPKAHWDYCRSEVLVMERMHGTPVNHIESLQARGVDLRQLSRHGVEIFFTQVFRDGFFHADMHPGNILVTDQGQYIALDFGIMGTLSDVDKHYLAVNFLAFFQRDYKRVALAHIESGWAPPGTRVDDFEAAIRAVCEPIFDRPLAQISFGRVLLRLFQTSRRFGIVIQPQLVLLQKTLLNIEGLGRQLDPELDLWDTAKPYLEQWMAEQIGPRGVWRRLRDEAPYWTKLLPELPRRMMRVLEQLEGQQQRHEVDTRQLERQVRAARWLAGLSALLAVAAAGMVWWRGG